MNRSEQNIQKYYIARAWFQSFFWVEFSNQQLRPEKHTRNVFQKILLDSRFKWKLPIHNLGSENKQTEFRFPTELLTAKFAPKINFTIVYHHMNCMGMISLHKCNGMHINYCKFMCCNGTRLAFHIPPFSLYTHTGSTSLTGNEILRRKWAFHWLAMVIGSQLYKTAIWLQYIMENTWDCDWAGLLHIFK